MWSVRFLSIFLLLLGVSRFHHQAAAAAEEEDDESHKVSVSIDTKDGSPQPYFATFDSTNVAYHWETAMIDDAQLDRQLNVIDADKLSAGALEEMLQKAKDFELATTNGLITDPEVDPRKIFSEAKLFQEAGPHNIHEFLRRNKAFVMFLLCDCEKDEKVARALPRLEELLEHSGFADLYSFMYLYPPATSGFQLHQVFDMTSQDIPALIIDNIQVGANMEKYRFEPLLESSPESKNVQIPQDMFHFIEQFQHRTLKMLVRSAPIPEDHDQYIPGKVKDVVANTFEQVVLDPERNVFLLVYSPRCGGSIAVQPVFRETAEELAGDPDILIARMDGTENDFPIRGIMLQHYPSAFFFPRGAAYNEDGQLNMINWDDYNGSKTPHNTNVPHSHYEKDSIVAFLRGKEIHHHDHDHVHEEEHHEEHHEEHVTVNNEEANQQMS